MVRVISVLAGLATAVLVGCGPGREASDVVVETPALLHDVPADGLTVTLVRDPAPVDELLMQDLDGNAISTRDWRGRVALVTFWATWCGPCRREIPDLIALQERYPDHLQVIGVSTDESGPAAVKEFAREWGINYPIVMETPELNRQFPGVFALPTTFVVDPDGLIVQTHVGLISPALLEQETRVLTSLPTTVSVETVEDTPHLRLVNAAHATELPGVDLSALSPEQREHALQRLNDEHCPCGCQLTLAQCRINDADCGISLPVAKRVVAQLREAGEAATNR
jgi:thiol-disulfide isomerase/thioredoxin